ncbi:MAG: hypothetical protein JWN04_6480 [Myxococcaceae bacterium]|nr:hypothetical protein [Myxococcaceae bacterium]
MFAPFTKRFASFAVDPFAGDRYRVRVAPDREWQEVSSCDALLALPLTNELDTELEPSTELDIQSFWSTAVDCLALRLVQAARPAQRSRMAPLLAAKDPSHLLPPGLSMVDFADERRSARDAAAQCHSLKDFDKSLTTRKTSPGRFTIRTASWSGELTFYAAGDLDSDGDEDVLVRRNGGAEGGGSYAGSALFLLSQTAQDSCMRIVRELGRS